MPHGLLAKAAGMNLPVEVLSSVRGFFLGTSTESGPFSRESEEYWRRSSDAQEALASGNWT